MKISRQQNFERKQKFLLNKVLAKQKRQSKCSATLATDALLQKVGISILTTLV